MMSFSPLSCLTRHLRHHAIAKSVLRQRPRRQALSQFTRNLSDSDSHQENNQTKITNPQPEKSVTQTEKIEAASVIEDDFFARVLARFPGGRSLSFAYGSGVFQQSGALNVKDNMTDFIFAVDDPVEWHSNNLEMNPNDYSGLQTEFSPT